MLNKIFDFFKIGEYKDYNTNFRYSYFTDSDLIDDTYYIYNFLFKRGPIDSEDFEDSRD